ncbi:ABC transporter ATP-binding protein [Gemmobacter serpentinus]|uniref:ABC transporter ATP-binding protein n=1 Tax=Gemmobacter serpentinus TaxID=2652247 RepID=UPI00124E7511|nr:ATP-binding cassette domain-containing protein [Gemmobacter serpentinus]
MAGATKSGARLDVDSLQHDLRPGERLLSLAGLKIVPGQFVVITGPSGGGKSTLLYLLSGLIAPTQGRINWDGTHLQSLSQTSRDRWRRERAGFVFQDFHLIPELSPLDNVLVPVWFSAFSAGAARSRAAALLDRFGVPSRRRVSMLSRGEQQRVAIARALIRSPAILFADEPTASLDAGAGAEVITMLREEARAAGRTVIAASHDPALIDCADLRLRLQRGCEVTTL